MSVSHTSSPARSDLGPPTTEAVDRPFLRHGAVLTAGASAWALCILAVGINPVGATSEAVYSLTSGLFQVGLLCLLRVLWLTRGLGAGRLARSVLRVEAGLVVLAIGSTVGDGLGVTDLDRLGWALLDASWPLSMLGMFFIGIRIAVAGRWTGVRRCWPMVAESWALVVIPVLGILGETVAAFVGAAHLLLGYAVLGVLVGRQQPPH